MTNETRSIEATDLVDFTFKIQQAILDGYLLSDKSDFAPQNIGWVFVTTMEKPECVETTVGNLTLAINVDAEQAVKNLEEIANRVGEVDAESAAQIIAQAVTVESNIVEPKTVRQTRGRK